MQSLDASHERVTRLALFAEFKRDQLIDVSESGRQLICTPEPDRNTNVSIIECWEPLSMNTGERHSITHRHDLPLVLPGIVGGPVQRYVTLVRSNGRFISVQSAELLTVPIDDLYSIRPYPQDPELHAKWVTHQR